MYNCIINYGSFLECLLTTDILLCLQEDEKPSSYNFVAFKKPCDLTSPKCASTKKQKKKKNQYDFEKDYDNWTPPVGQTGDGRTALNDKLGY